MLRCHNLFKISNFSIIKLLKLCIFIYKMMFTNLNIIIKNAILILKVSFLKTLYIENISIIIIINNKQNLVERWCYHKLILYVLNSWWLLVKSWIFKLVFRMYRHAASDVLCVILVNVRCALACFIAILNVWRCCFCNWLIKK